MSLTPSEFVKIQVFVPVTHADVVREALCDAGAGKMGNYDSCTASMRVVGRFRALTGAHPAIGEVGKLEEVEEELIQTLCHKDLVQQVIAAVKKVHPYEEVPIDILPRFEIE